MSLYTLIYLIFLSVLLTFVSSVALRNKGPWNHAVYYFLALFLTSWAIILWTANHGTQRLQMNLIPATVTVILLSILLSSSRRSQVSRDKMRRIEDQEVVEVVTRQVSQRERFLPGFYFWLLLSIDTILILLAYLRNQNLFQV